MTTLLLLHGPNLSQLGHRDREHYGTMALDGLVALAREAAAEAGAELVHEQHDSEGDLVARVQEARSDGSDGLVINPGALAHYSYALRDALEILTIPKVEVHLSNVHAREDFRTRSVVTAACDGILGGFGPSGYPLAVRAALDLIAKRSM